MNEKQLRLSIPTLQAIAWGTSIIATILALVAWGSSYDWQLSNLGIYGFFPLLGLVAYGLMLSHYVSSVLRTAAGHPRAALAQYFHSTSLVVLVLILLHPGLFIYQLFIDGYGLPPGSYLTYYGPAFAMVLLFGTVSWVAFLAYETGRWFAKKPWWWLVARASDVAMVLIFFHALRLGGQLQTGWFRTVWYLYGLVLAICLVMIYINLWRQRLDKS